MKNFILWSLVGVLAMLRLAVAQANTDNGIVVLDGFPHGVILCGEGMIINPGYEDDLRVQQLIELAEDVCPQ